MATLHVCLVRLGGGWVSLREKTSEVILNPKFRAYFTRTVFLLPFLASAQAATYYVSVSGSDSNPGTAAAPFATVSKGVAAATSPGDTVIVMNGTYGNEGVTQPNYVVTLNSSGTPGNPITIMAQNRGEAILDGGNTSTGTTCTGASSYFNLYNASYIVIQGFVIQNSCNQGFQSNNSANNITIRWNEIRNIGNWTDSTQYGLDGIYLNSSEYNFTFDGNIFHDIGRVGGITPMHFDHGIYSAAQGLTVINNVFYNMTKGWDMQIAGGAANYLIANNTFAGATAGDGAIMFWEGNANMTLTNNIFYEQSNAAVTQYAATLSGEYDHNLIYGNTTFMSGGGGLTEGAGNVFGPNPDFVNPTSTPPNFALQAGSPAIGAGVVLSAVVDDITGATRPTGGAADLGAYAYTTTATSSTSSGSSGSSGSTGSTGSSGSSGSNPSASSFSLTSSGSVTIAQGAAGSVPLTVTLLSGSPVAASFSVTSQSGLTTSLASASCTASCTNSLAISAASTLAPGIYTLIVTATGGTTTANAVITITVTAAISSSGGGGGNATTGLMARWPLDESSGTVAHDISGNGNNGTVYNGYWWTSVHGPCLWFDGSGSMVNVAESPTLEETNALTVTFWLDPNANTDLDPRIITKLYDWDVKLNTATRYPEFETGPGQYAMLKFSPGLQSWQHIAFVYSNGTVTGYVNGVAVPFVQNTFTGSGTLSTYQYGMYLGTDATQTYNFIGSLADVRIYNRALSAADIAAVYAGQ